MSSRPPPLTTPLAYQGTQQTVQAHFRQSFASAPPVVAQGGNARIWDGHVLQCCGNCDGSGWATCIVGSLLPCVLSGKLRERAFGQSCFCWGLLFCLLTALLVLTCFQIGHFTYFIPRYFKVVSLLFLGLALMLLGASTRSAIRKRFGLPGSNCQDFCLWICCPLCVLCQEARTLEKNNVNDGEWFGQTSYLPVLTQPPTPQAHTPRGHTPRGPHTPPLPPHQTHASMYGYHNQYQPPVYQHPGYQTIPSPTSVSPPAPSAPPVPGIPMLEAEPRAPKV